MSRYASTLRTVKALLIIALFIATWPQPLTKVAAQTLNFSPTVAPSNPGVGTTVNFSGSGFSPSDSSCMISGIPVSAAPVPTCTATGGTVSGTFYVAYAAAGQYPVTVIDDTGVSASAQFTIALTLTPTGVRVSESVGEPGTTVTFMGAGFDTSDTGLCTVSGVAVATVPQPTCFVGGGSVSGSFIVGSVSVCSGPYPITVTGSGGHSATAQFNVPCLIPNPLAPNTPSGTGGTGDTVAFSGNHFALTDTACFVSSSAATQGICSIVGGLVSGSFVMACGASPAQYTVTVTGSPGGDFAEANFTLALSLSLCSSGIGSEVSFMGLPFQSTDTWCSIESIAIPAENALSNSNLIQKYPTSPGAVCAFDHNRAVTGYFIVGNVSAARYGIQVCGNPSRLCWDPVFTVIDVGLGVSPGRYDLKLREGFPNFGKVKLTYLNSAIYVNSVGDLLFNVSLDSHSTNSLQGIQCSVLGIPDQKCPDATLYQSLDIYIPPDFSGITTQNVWTSFTNNYDTSLSLSVGRASSADSIGPNWWKVHIVNLYVVGNLNYPQYNYNMTANRIFVANQSQYVRLFQVTSPAVAGRYFFKAFVNGTIPIGTAEYPTLVVKASRDPAYISGTLRDSGEAHPNRAGLPIALPRGYGARIFAWGRDYLGNNVTAQAFINWAANGAYTLFGVAPGTYNITAYAAGYLPTTCLKVATVRAAQSLDSVDIYMTESVDITGRVLSESSNGALIPWGSAPGGASGLPIQVQLLQASTTASTGVTYGSLVASTPAPYGVLLTTTPHLSTFNFSIRRQVGFDGRIPQDFANYTSGVTSGDYFLRAYVSSYIQLEDVYVHVTNQTLRTWSEIPLIRSGIIRVTVHFMNYNGSIRPDQSNATINGIPTSGTLTLNAYDERGILRAQNITTVPQFSTSTTAELLGFILANQRGIQSLRQSNYGLMPGTYHIQASLTSSPSFAGFANVGIRNLYFQTQDIQVTIGLGQVLELISFPMYEGGGISFTLRSIDGQTPSISRRWAHPGAPITVKIIDPTGTVYQTNATQPESCPSGYFWNEQNGSGGCVPRPTPNPISPNILFGDNDSLTLLYFGLLTNTYTVIIQTVGYSQREILTVHVVLCSTRDASIWMIQDPEIDLTLTFKHEDLLTLINSTKAYAQPINHLDATPTRLELFDERGYFAAANWTYIPNLTFNRTNTNCPVFNSASWPTGGVGCSMPTRTVDFHLAGFRRYFGDPRLVWSGFYDTTDAGQQSDGGILPGTYSLRIWVDGYYQSTSIKVTLPEQTFGRKEVSIVNSVYRASRINGTVLGPDLYDKARPLSWASVTLQPRTFKTSNWGNFTTYTLDGKFQVWAPPASYNAGISLKGYTSYAGRLEVSPGADIQMWVWMESG